MRSKRIVGATDLVHIVQQAWAAPSTTPAIKSLLIAQKADHAFDFAPLDTLDTAVDEIFVAFDERFGNFKREELLHAILARGFTLAPSLISASASIAPDAIIGRNVFIGEQVVIGPGCRIEDNTFILAGACLGSSVQLGASCWIESGVQIAGHVDVGHHSTLRMGALLASGIRVGDQCELGWSQLYRTDIRAKTVYDPRYDEPIHTYDGEGAY